MTIYLYEDITLNYIGEVTVHQNKMQLDSGALIWANKQKYIVVNSNDVTPANVKNEIMNGRSQVPGQAMKHMLFSVTVKKV